MVSRKLRVYLGGSKGTWRRKFAKENQDCECYDPFKHSKQTALVSFTQKDLQAVKETDVLFIYINYKIYTGSCIEAGFAFARGIPIILVFELKGYIDPLLLGISRKVFTDLDSAIDWFKKSTYVKKVRK